MGTILYYPSLLLSSSLYPSNDTSISDENVTDDHLLHLLILIAVWVVLIFTIAVGSIGNLLVLYVYINRNDNRTCTFFVKMLAIVDLIICSILAPLELYQTTTGIRNELLCKSYGFLTTHVLYSTFLITTIAFDRYFCICWPLYRILTIHRARAIVVICGILSSLFAIIPMSEYSTKENILHIHSNHSEQLSLDIDEQSPSPFYIHAEHIQINSSELPFIIGNATHVKCSPKFSLHLPSSDFIRIYRIFHSALFAVCIILVIILYTFIYNAIYRRRRRRTRKFSTYGKILHTYIVHDDQEGEQSHRHSFLTYVCCYCCRKSSHESVLHESTENQKYSSHDKSSVVKKKSEQIVLEINGARGKRYSAVSMTSMTYLTSGVWDEASPTNLVRSRINSIAATTYCGMEQSSTSRPSTSTDDSIEQTTKLKPNSTFLTVPGQSTLVSTTSFDINNKDNQLNETEYLSIAPPSPNLLHLPAARKSSNTLSIRQQRSSETSPLQRKVSFMTSSAVADHCIIEDLPSTNLSPVNQSLPNQKVNSRSFSTTSSLTINPTRNSVSSSRRGSTFDCETERIFERQQRQERLANIRTTLTLFVVTATFILMYLPSITITLFNIKPNEFREVLFLLYYINSACNPLIYSFFNVNFRNDIRRIYECQQREFVARQC